MIGIWPLGTESIAEIKCDTVQLLTAYIASLSEHLTGMEHLMISKAQEKRGEWARGGDKHMMGKLHNTIHQNDWKPQVRDWIPFWVVNDLRSGCVNLRGHPKEHTRSQLKPTPDLKNGGATKAARTSSRSSSLGFSNILHRIPKCMFPFMFSSHMIYSDSRFIRD